MIIIKNYFLFKLKSKIKLNIKGKNLERFIKRLVNNKIELIKINYLKRNEFNIIIYRKDYDKLLELKSIYDVTQMDIYGIIKIRKIIGRYKYIIFSIVIGFIFLFLLSNIIFDVEVIHNNSEIRDLLYKELEENNIKKYELKKSYDEIQKIKENILDKYKDSIEWLEITRKGTKYIIRVEERIIPDNTKDETKQNIVAKKSAVLKKIIANSGNIEKEVNTYVNKGDVIISGNIYLNENLKDVIRADGVVYGEVWYKVNVEYPYVYIENKETGNVKDVFVLKILNKSIEFTTNKFKDKRVEEEKLITNSLLPISLVKQKQYEIINIEEILTQEQAREKAINSSIEKMNQKLNDDEYIDAYQVLNENIKDDKIVLEIFFTVVENITDYEEIKEGEENVSKNDYGNI